MTLNLLPWGKIGSFLPCLLSMITGGSFWERTGQTLVAGAQAWHLWNSEKQEQQAIRSMVAHMTDTYCKIRAVQRSLLSCAVALSRR